MVVDKINIVIPVFNPHPGWEIPFTDHLGKLEKELAALDYQIILVNDGSTKHIEKLDEVRAMFPKLKYYPYDINRGKGHAIRYGIGKAEADYYFYTDVDFPFGCSMILNAYNQLKSTGINLVVGTREKCYFGALPFERRLISYMFIAFIRIISGFKLKDTQAPMKGMDNTARAILLGTKTDGFIFDFEFLYKCLRRKLKFVYISLQAREGLIFTEFSNKTIFREFINLIKLTT